MVFLEKNNLFNVEINGLTREPNHNINRYKILETIVVQLFDLHYFFCIWVLAGFFLIARENVFVFHIVYIRNNNNMVLKNSFCISTLQHVFRSENAMN